MKTATAPLFTRHGAKAALLVLMLLGTGCTALLIGGAAGAGAAGAAYVRGDLEADVQADPPAVEAAALKAFDSLDIHPISSSSSALDARIVGRTATDAKVTLTAEARNLGGSTISIRVGTFGDEAKSRRIYEELKKYLP